MSLLNILKFTLIIGFGVVLTLGINAMLAFILPVIIAPVIVEIIGIMSCCFPFDAGAVLGSIYSAISVILTFLICKKVFDLQSWSLSTTN